MGKACERFQTPVTGGNVSFYNHTVLQTGEIPVFPTPTIGMLGLVMDKSKVMTLSSKNTGDLLYLLGTSRNDISSSEYLASYHGQRHSPAPHFDLEEEYELQQVVKKLINERLIQSAHDVSDGGLFQCLLEKGLKNRLGFTIQTDPELRKDAFLFGEAQSRVVVSVSPEEESAFVKALGKHPYELLGEVTDADVVIDGEPIGNMAEFIALHENAIESRLK